MHLLTIKLQQPALAGWCIIAVCCSKRLPRRLGFFDPHDSLCILCVALCMCMQLLSVLCCMYFCVGGCCISWQSVVVSSASAVMWQLVYVSALLSEQCVGCCVCQFCAAIGRCAPAAWHGIRPVFFSHSRPGMPTAAVAQLVAWHAPPAMAAAGSAPWCYSMGDSKHTEQEGWALSACSMVQVRVLRIRRSAVACCVAQ